MSIFHPLAPTSFSLMVTKREDLCGLIKKPIVPPSPLQVSGPMEFLFRGGDDTRHYQFLDEVGVISDRLGFKYLSMALSQPRTAINVKDARGALDGRDARHYGGANIEVTDEETILSLQAKAKAIVAEIEDAKEFGDTERQAELMQELETINTHIRKIRNHKGRPRNLSEAENTRSNVKKAIRGALNYLRTKAPKLAAYLDERVRTGYSLVFHPLDRETWIA